MKNLKTFHIFLFVALVALALVGVACSGSSGPTVVQVKLNEYNIIMDKTSIPAGEVRFEIENTGTELHEVVLEPAGTEDEPFELNGVESEVEDIEAGGKATLEWTIDQPGEYQLSCYVKEDDETEDHAAKGMITTFTVNP